MDIRNNMQNEAKVQQRLADLDVVATHLQAQWQELTAGIVAINTQFLDWAAQDWKLRQRLWLLEQQGASESKAERASLTGELDAAVREREGRRAALAEELKELVQERSDIERQLRRRVRARLSVTRPEEA